MTSMEQEISDQVRALNDAITKLDAQLDAAQLLRLQQEDEERARDARIIEIPMVVTRLVIPCGVCGKPQVRDQWCPRTAYCSPTHANLAYRHRKAARKSAASKGTS